MMHPEIAYEMMISRDFQIQRDDLSLSEACGRVLFRDVLSPFDHPPFDRSAMDGYACKKTDIRNNLKIIEHIHAGFSPLNIIEHGTCAKIKTEGGYPWSRLGMSGKNCC